eukprot:TRINITY_DN4156_c4_g1_i1.p1 TRINITY_DN4156_c4_g1~~TRINITY_DN4156_c4_g1_i1.p1  ORF type:complete len:420 (+),score=125.14 TRINITY_DN4156_c4_g1_i1:12-1271(+)
MEETTVICSCKLYCRTSKCECYQIYVSCSVDCPCNCEDKTKVDERVKKLIIPKKKIQIRVKKKKKLKLKKKIKNNNKNESPSISDSIEETNDNNDSDVKELSNGDNNVNGKKKKKKISISKIKKINKNDTKNNINEGEEIIVDNTNNNNEKENPNKKTDKSTNMKKKKIKTVRSPPILRAKKITGKKRKRKSVSFGNVEITEFERDISTSTVPTYGGYPLGLSWNVKRQYEKELEESSNNEDLNSNNGEEEEEEEDDDFFVDVEERKRKLSHFIDSTRPIPKRKPPTDRSKKKKTLNDLQDNTEDFNTLSTITEEEINYIRGSRVFVGCNCSGLGNKKSRKKNPKICHSKKCTCFTSEHDCHYSVCGCFHCENPYGKHSVDFDRLQANRERILDINYLGDENDDYIPISKPKKKKQKTK